MPPVKAAVHATHVPSHAALQQTPSAQNPLAHCEACMHATPAASSHAPAPLHSPAGHSLAVSSPERTGAHEPFVPPVKVAVHASHVPSHTSPQQTPSTQKLLAQSVFIAQVSPRPFLQPPAPSQTAAPMHSFAGSLPNPMFAHVPSAPATLHALHVPPQVLSQQTPSVQKPLRHSPAPPQEAPLTFTQAPVPLHTSAPLHSLAGSVFVGTLLQMPGVAPRLQVLQVPEQAFSQQTLSTQKPLRHSAFSAQPPPFTFLQLPVASQVAPAPQVSCWPAATGAQTPMEPALLHVWQSPLHALLQQTPSTQMPLWHSPFATQADPFGSSQSPNALHSDARHSLSGSLFVATFPQTPFAPPVFAALHALHVPVQALLQQTPSVQKPDWHSEAIVQLDPSPSSPQAPIPLQAAAPEHSASGSRPLETGEQVPFAAPFFAALQAEQRPVQAVLQQKPSAQKVLKHSALLAQGWPFASTHLPEPLQTWMPVQAGCASVWPLGMFAQTPRLPGSAQLLHSSVQVLEQQTPSTQLPEVHSLFAPHMRPFVFFGSHAMLLQKLPVAQSVSAVHVRLQFPPLHA